RRAAYRDVACADDDLSGEVQVASDSDSGIAGVNRASGCNQVDEAGFDSGCGDQLADAGADHCIAGVQEHLTLFVCLDDRWWRGRGALRAAARIDVPIGSPQDDIAALQSQNAGLIDGETPVSERVDRAGIEYEYAQISLGGNYRARRRGHRL